MTDAGLDVKAVRDNFGHATIGTTSIYVHSEDNARHDATQAAHKIGWAPPAAKQAEGSQDGRFSGEKRVAPQAFGRRIQHGLIYRALSVALLSIAFVFVTGLLLELTTPPDFPFVHVIFESVSAFGTVGASTGVTLEMPDPARVIMVVAMFVGRLGPLTLVLALTNRARPVRVRPAVETLRIG